jgi:hypothetical protein
VSISLGFGRPRVGRRGVGGGEERFDGDVVQDDQSCDRSQTAGERLVATRVADAASDVLAAKSFEIICGVAGAGGVTLNA